MSKKPRKRARWGVFPAAVAYCQCGWHSGWHATKGCFAEAHGELHIHRQTCPQGGEVYDEHQAALKRWSST